MNTKYLKSLCFVVSLCTIFIASAAGTTLGGGVAVGKSGLGLTTSSMTELPKSSLSTTQTTNLGTSGLGFSRQTSFTGSNGASSQTSVNSLPGLYTKDSTMTTASGKTSDTHIAFTKTGTDTNTYTKNSTSLSGKSVDVSSNKTADGTNYTKTITNPDGSQRTITNNSTKSSSN